jgi:hypothetical protein
LQRVFVTNVPSACNPPQNSKKKIRAPFGKFKLRLKGGERLDFGRLLVEYMQVEYVKRRSSQSTAVRISEDVTERHGKLFWGGSLAKAAAVDTRDNFRDNRSI